MGSKQVAKMFVYGALRRGASNHWRINGAEFLGETTLKGTLVKIDWYPGLVLSGKTPVLGEVYAVDEELLAKLDEFEGLTNGSNEGEYARVTAVVKVGSAKHEVCVYEWQKGVADYEVVSNGDWLTDSASR